MPYIGNNLATQFQAFATQTITGDGSTSYTLDRAVANGKELLVYINNVKQEEGSGKSYTASGTTITFSAAVASTDSCYVVYMGSAQQTVTAPAGSIVSSQFSSSDIGITGNLGVGTTSPSQKLHVSASNPFLELQGTASTSGDTGIFLNANANHWILKADNYSSTNAFQIKQGDTSSSTAFMTIDANGHITKPLQPAFQARVNSIDTNFAINTFHTANFGTEVFDQNGDFSSNTFTAPVTGRYQLNLIGWFEDVASSANYLQVEITTSNTRYFGITDPTGYDQTVTYLTLPVCVLADMDANDTATVRYYQRDGDVQIDLGTDTTFSGYLVA
jgi:hypothetical protein